MIARGLPARANRVLDSLTTADAAFIHNKLELVPLDLNAVLFEQGAEVTHIYFPVSGLISLVTRVGGAGVESATVGAEGMLGLPVFLHSPESTCDSVVQMKGEAWRLPAAAFLESVERCPAWSDSLKRYSALSLWMSYRSAASNQVHSLAQRTARWLLLAQDHAKEDNFNLTHRLLSQMLGVRRAGVTTALGALQREGIISTRRGRIAVLDRRRLEGEACECDALMRARSNSPLV